MAGVKDRDAGKKKKANTKQRRVQWEVSDFFSLATPYINTRLNTEDIVRNT